MDATLPRPAAACPERRPADRFTLVPNALFDLGLTPRAYQLVVALLSYRWQPESPILPSVPTLARLLGTSARTVQRTLRALERRGLLVVQARYRADGGQTSNGYVLAGALLAAVTPVDARRVTPPVTRVTPAPVTRPAAKRHPLRNQTPGDQSTGRLAVDPAAYTTGALGRYIHT